MIVTVDCINCNKPARREYTVRLEDFVPNGRLPMWQLVVAVVHENGKAKCRNRQTVATLPR